MAMTRVRSAAFLDKRVFAALRAHWLCVATMLLASACGRSAREFPTKRECDDLRETLSQTSEAEATSAACSTDEFADAIARALVESARQTARSTEGLDQCQRAGIRSGRLIGSISALLMSSPADLSRKKAFVRRILGALDSRAKASMSVQAPHDAFARDTTESGAELAASWSRQSTDAMRTVFRAANGATVPAADDDCLVDYRMGLASGQAHMLPRD